MTEPFHTRGPVTVFGDEGTGYWIPCSFCHRYEGACQCSFVDFETSRRILLTAPTQAHEEVIPMGKKKGKGKGC